MSIRLAREADLPQILAIYAPYVLNTPYSLEYTVPTEEEFLRRFRTITSQFPWLVWEEDSKILGYAYGSLPFTRAGYCWSGEASIYLAPEAHRKGIGKKLYMVLEEIMRLQGYRVIYAIITGTNETSLSFHRALGYRQTAVFPRCGYKMGQWVDVVWMEKELQTLQTPGIPPVSAETVVKSNRKFCDILDKMSLS